MYHFTGKAASSLLLSESVAKDAKDAATFEDFGRQLREARERKGYNRATLAFLSGVSKNHIAAAELGANVTIGVLAKLAPHLDLGTLRLPHVQLDAEVPRAEVVAMHLARALREMQEALEVVGVTVGAHDPFSDPWIAGADEHATEAVIRESSSKRNKVRPGTNPAEAEVVGAEPRAVDIEDLTKPAVPTRKRAVRKNRRKY